LVLGSVVSPPTAGFDFGSAVKCENTNPEARIANKTNAVRINGEPLTQVMCIKEASLQA
jgi:hypothetical protein